MAPMGQVTRVLLLLAVVVPVTAYVAGSLASPGSPAPPDHSPVILRDAPDVADEPPAPDRTPGGRSPGTPWPDPDRPDGGPGQDPQRGGGDEARVVTPKPTPVGEDDDDEWDDDDGPDDDDTDDEWDD